MHAFPVPQCRSLVQPDWPCVHTFGHSPPQPSLGFAQVAWLQSGLQTQAPQMDCGPPHRLGSFEGQRESRHTSRLVDWNSFPASRTHTSPEGQMLAVSASHPVAHAQLVPHGLSDCPHAPFTPSAHSAAQQTRFVRGALKQPPFPVPHTKPEAQSVSALQPPPRVQGAQEPPQSMSDSLPSRTPF